MTQTKAVFAHYTAKKKFIIEFYKIQKIRLLKKELLKFIEKKFILFDLPISLVLK